MRQVDEVLLDPELLSIVYEALARRWPKSRTRGRPGTPADMVLRLLLLKHIRNWSYRALERRNSMSELNRLEFIPLDIRHSDLA
jgi:transposase, IS5 family